MCYLIYIDIYELFFCQEGNLYIAKEDNCFFRLRYPLFDIRNYLLTLLGIWHSLVVFFASKWMFDEGSFHSSLLVCAVIFNSPNKWFLNYLSFPINNVLITKTFKFAAGKFHILNVDRIKFYFATN